MYIDRGDRVWAEQVRRRGGGGKCGRGEEEILVEQNLITQIVNPTRVGPYTYSIWLCKPSSNAKRKRKKRRKTTWEKPQKSLCRFSW
jgi:hypothetical protein